MVKPKRKPCRVKLLRMTSEDPQENQRRVKNVFRAKTLDGANIRQSP